MVAVLTGVLGLVLGATLAWSLAQRRTHSNGDALSEMKVAARRAHLRTGGREQRVGESSTRTRGGSRQYGGVFENLSNRVLQQTVHQFNQSQEQAMKERENTLDRTLKPLADLLDEYKRNLAEFDKQHVGALGEVKSRADELLNEQRKSPRGDSPTQSTPRA